MERARAARRYSRFRLKAFVRRVNRRSCIRRCRFCRSMCEVQIRSSAGGACTAIFSKAIIRAGEYRRSLSTVSLLYVLTNCA